MNDVFFDFSSDRHWVRKSDGTVEEYKGDEK